jgi:hypothetical protein
MCARRVPQAPVQDVVLLLDNLQDAVVCCCCVQVQLLKSADPTVD